MILAFDHLGETHCLNNPEDVSESLDDLFRVDPEGKIHARAEWVFLEKEGDLNPVSMLEVSANLKHGLGGVVWSVWEDARRFKKNPEDPQDDLGDHFWLSDSRNPPNFDPEVLVDHQGARYFDPRGVLPLSEIREVVEEYFRLLGNRPTRINWVSGTQDGVRYSTAS